MLHCPVHGDQYMAGNPHARSLPSNVLGLLRLRQPMAMYQCDPAELQRCHRCTEQRISKAGEMPSTAATLTCPAWGVQVGVIGLGGLGHLALQFARAVGAEVYAISGSKKKEAEAKKLGAHHFTSLDDLPDETLDVLLNTTPECALFAYEQ